MGRTPRLLRDGGLPDLSLYERLIGDGLAAYDSRGGTVDHLTARRPTSLLAVCRAQKSRSSGW
jgi:hypothetical protein